MPIFKLCVLLAVVVGLLRLRFSVGVAVLVACGVAHFLLGMSAEQSLQAAKEAVTLRFADLTSSIVLVTMLGELLRRAGFLDRLTTAAKLLPGGERSAVVMLPAAVGMMPMPGGAYVSAPLVDAVLLGQPLAGSFKTVLNYWFRHMVEFSWPLYPSLILASGVLHVPIIAICVAQFPLTLTALTIGAILFLPKVSRLGLTPGRWSETAGRLLRALWPILLVVAIMATRLLPMGVAIIISLIAVTMAARPARADLQASIMEGLKPSLLVVVFSVLLFERMLSISGVLSQANADALRLGIPGAGVVVITCFLIGLLTSMSAAVVGLGFSLAAPFLYQPTIQPAMLTLGYLAGFVGMMLSPTHLCLILTSRHFGAPVPTVYRHLLLPLTILTVLGVVYCLSPIPALVYGYLRGR